MTTTMTTLYLTFAAAACLIPLACLASAIVYAWRVNREINRDRANWPGRRRVARRLYWIEQYRRAGLSPR